MNGAQRLAKTPLPIAMTPVYRNPKSIKDGEYGHGAHA